MKAIILARVSTKEQEQGPFHLRLSASVLSIIAPERLEDDQDLRLIESSTRGDRKEFAAMLAAEPLP
jgi:DNA invertase Pin-like site-specific DNA recombinase